MTGSSTSPFVRTDERLSGIIEDRQARERVQIEIKYEGYLKRQEEQVRQFEKNESVQIPADFEFHRIEISQQRREGEAPEGKAPLDRSGGKDKRSDSCRRLHHHDLAPQVMFHVEQSEPLNATRDPPHGGRPDTYATGTDWSSLTRKTAFSGGTSRHCSNGIQRSTSYRVAIRRMFGSATFSTRSHFSFILNSLTVSGFSIWGREEASRGFRLPLRGRELSSFSSIRSGRRRRRCRTWSNGSD